MPSRPPTDAEVNAAIAELEGKADSIGYSGGSEEPFLAAIACIEWARGRESTAAWIPYYLPFNEPGR